MTVAERVQAADEYLAARAGTFDQRCIRYGAVRREMGWLADRETVVDVGAGWTELDAYLRSNGAHRSWRGRYYPVDACLDGTDLEHWVPPREAEWFVALEVLEHLQRPARLVHEMQRCATRAVVISTPNPETTDVLGMDPTHRTPISRAFLESLGFTVEARSFYGQPDDSLFAVWRR